MTNKTLKNWILVLALTGSAPVMTFAAPVAAPQAEQTSARCTGVVLDADGEPLPGASVRVEGAQIGGTTDIDGNFSLAGVKKGAKITVTYIGYTPATVVWNGSPLSITLKDDNKVLDEVVVMGYGVEQKRAKVTNSIAKVSEKDLTIGANANPAQALVGAVSGVKVTVNSGDPGATPAITVRGGTNWNGSANEPLIVVDGQIRSSLSDINPNDIGSMEILKDAGATALYGARAANGVVLITTKSGKVGEGRVTLNVKYGLSHYDTGYDMMNAREYLHWVRTATYNTTNPDVPGNWLNNFYPMLFNGSQAYSTGKTELSQNMPWNILTYTDDNAYLLNHGWQVMDDPLNGVLGTDTRILFKDTDIMKYSRKDPTSTQDYNLSFSGANDRGNYYASLGYYNADGALPKQYYKRYNFAFTGSYKISQWLESKSVFNYTRANWVNTSSGLATGRFFGRVMSMPPTIRLEDEEGNPLYNTALAGASVNLKYQPDKYHPENQSDKFQMTQSLTAKIIDGLTLKGTMSWYYNEQLSKDFTQDIQTNAAGAMNRNRPTSESFSRYFDQTYNLVANFNRTFAEKHTVNAMLGMEFYKRKYQTFSASGNGATTDDFGNLQYAFTGTQSPYKASSLAASSNTYEEAILSYFGRAEYDYMDKYLIAATFRQDGYSRLQNHRWGFFPGVSAGWVFTRENFFSDNSDLSFLNYGKLRASYGMNGIVNSSVIGYYTLLGAYSAYQYGGNIGYRISGLPNLNLRWERTRTAEVGLDLGFLSNRFNLGITYYNRLTMDKYANKSLPQTTGFSTVVTNNGSFRNQGVEFDFNGTLIRTKDFTWTLGANLTYNKNVVVDLPYNGQTNNRQNGTQVYDGNKLDENGKPATIYLGGLQEGQEPMHIIGYKKRQILRSQADVEALGDYIDISLSALSSVYIYANESGLERLRKMDPAAAAKAVKLRPGDAIWCDRNGDNTIDQLDQYDLGNRMPHWTGGFNTTFSWKGLSLYARFDMGFGFKVYDSSFCWWMGGGQGTYSAPTAVKDTWTPENVNAKYPR
ncbi:MAG: SusC/RagA family TonB-linked outer membrane protein, partial [Muribaculaceae bacterium]|nr:SusC/RagA family TonB-linked outer membrane protein [Muribaculaceae bacterium]